jgi:outer membrane lipoprotein SlyB
MTSGMAGVPRRDKTEVVMRRYILLGASLVLAVAAQAAEPLKPTDKQLKALCDGCAVVTEVHTESRKGQASGVGAVGGAVGGAVVGKKLGDSGAATVGGAVIGGLLGNEIEKRVKKHTVWVITTKGRDGAEQRYELAQDPHLQAGDTVHPEGNGLKKR